MTINIISSMLVVSLIFLTGIAATAQTLSHQAMASFGKLPLSFEPNQGQAGPDAQFVSRGTGYTVLLSPTSATIALQRNAPIAGAVARMDLLGTHPDLRLNPRTSCPASTTT